MSRLTEQEILTDDYTYRCSINKFEYGKGKREILNKLGKIEDLEEQLGCSFEIVVKAFKKYVEWTTACDFGYDNIPDEYEKYKDDGKFKVLSYSGGLIYIAIQETLRKDKSE